MIVYYSPINVVFSVPFDYSCQFSSHETSKKWFPFYTVEINAARVCGISQGVNFRGV